MAQFTGHSIPIPECDIAIPPWSQGRTQNMERFLRIQDLTPAEIEAAIDAADVELGVDELLAVQEFVDQIGGVANARLAIEMLSKLEDAA